VFIAEDTDEDDKENDETNDASCNAPPGSNRQGALI
jgi:hypothetical protein